MGDSSPSNTAVGPPLPIFLSSTLDSFINNKEIKKSTLLKDAVSKSIDCLKESNVSKLLANHSTTLLTPFLLVFSLGVVKSTNLIIMAQDACFRIISHSQFPASPIMVNPDPFRSGSGYRSATSSLSAQAKPDDSSVASAPATNEKIPLVDLVADIVSGCFVIEGVLDEKIQLATVRVITAAIVSSNCPLHQSALINGIRAIYNIFIFMKSPANQVIAQQSIKQIIECVFTRLSHAYQTHPKIFETIQWIKAKTEVKDENHANSKEKDPHNGKEQDPNSNPSPPPPVTQENGSSPSNGFDATEEKKVHHEVEEVKEEDHKEEDLKEENRRSSDGSVDLVLENVLGSKHKSQENALDSNVSDSANETPKASAVNAEGKYGVCIVCSKQANYYCKDTMVPVCSKECKMVNLENFKKDQQEQEKLASDATKADTAATTEQPAIVQENRKMESVVDDEEETLRRHLEILLKDAFVIFKAMFKLASKGLTDIPNPPAPGQPWDLSRSGSVRSKLLALQQIHYMLETFGTTVVLNFEMFPEMIRSNMTVVILRSVLSPVTPLFEISLEILVDLLIPLRSLFKAENEILLNEVVLSLLDSRTTTSIEQRHKIMDVICSRMSVDSAFLVELFLNYDCDADSTENLFEKLVNICTKIIQSRVDNNTTPLIQQEEQRLKRKAISCHASILKSMLEWSLRPQVGPISAESPTSTAVALDNDDQPLGASESSATQFEEMKHRKQVIAEGIRLFNWKIKKGMTFFFKSKCIENDTPKDVAKFLLNTEGLSKKNIGEFLGEGEQYNINIMHAFVELMDFSGLKFVDALRLFLQSFRLPGEAQKIDRFMLKFAQQFVLYNPAVFANADTAYVLAYSVIMLNTDLHNPQIKKRMSKPDFVKNNRGINDNANLPQEFLEEIYEEILNNEIKMKEEQLAELKDNTKEFTSVRRKREAMMQVTEDLASKVEGLFRELETKRARLFFRGHQPEHVRPMILSCWLYFLSGLSGPLQESDEPETLHVCLDGVKSAIRITCHFDMDLERNAFISAISKFTMLSNVNDLSLKNIEAVKVLLDVAWMEGNHLQKSWMDVIRCISLLEKFQIVSNSDAGMSMMQANQSSDAVVAKKQLGKRLALEESLSQSMVIAIDKIFSSSHKLSGTAIMEFIKALSVLSWEEISTSSKSDTIRTYCLQKIVEISYYNMGRIRLEWSNIWSILGEHFNQVGCHQNYMIANFAVDSLRQLSVKFLEKEEMSQFKFQREFLKPFEFIVANNTSPQIQDLVVCCLKAMIQSKGKNIKSGWKTIFNVFSKAAEGFNEQVIVDSFDAMKFIAKERLKEVVMCNAFLDFSQCLVVFAKNKKFMKISLQAVEMIKGSISKMAELSRLDAERREQEQEDGEAPNTNSYSDEDPSVRFWFPIHFALYQVLMTCELEVRARALTYLFDCLKQYGGQYSQKFWATVCKEVIFPIFDDLKPEKKRKFFDKDDMSEWMSTTLVQALRNFIDLLTHFFETVAFLLASILDLLTTCINQENETLARIGTACLQQLIENNHKKLNFKMWHEICDTFDKLFQETMPNDVFAIIAGDDSSEGDEAGGKGLVRINSNTLNNSEGITDEGDETAGLHVSEQNLSGGVAAGAQDKRKVFHKIILKCILQLLLIQTIQDIMVTNSEVCHTVDSKHIMRILDCLDRSYQFSRKFNTDLKLRLGLLRQGYTKQLPNMIKQETSSVAVYLDIIFKTYFDANEGRRPIKPEIEKRFITLTHDVLLHYIKMEPESKQKIIGAWKSVVILVLKTFYRMEDATFKTYVPELYMEMIQLLRHDMPIETRTVLKDILERTAIIFKIVPSKN